MKDGMNTLFALDIGGTQIKAARVSESGQLLSLRKVPTPPTLDAFRSVASSLAAEFGPGAIAAGIGCKGRIDEDSTRVLVLPGTLRYLAPELRSAGSALRAAPASDLFAAGVVLLEFALHPRPLPAVFDQVGGDFDAAEHVPKDLPDGWSPRLARLLAADPAARGA